MIRVVKPKAPKALLGKGEARRDEHIAEYMADRAAYDAGNKTLAFDSKIYGAASVKNALIKAQHGKCCFCESKVRDVAHGDVEHFRPKGGFQQAASDPLGRPGYYWLAYDWPNLYFSCQICNQSHKKNLFPLRDPKKRARRHTQSLAREAPMLVDPGADNPEEHIGFNRDVPVGVTDRGDATIEVTGLTRPDLSDSRRDYYNLMKVIHDISLLGADAPNAGQARVILEEHCADSGEYAAMLRRAVEVGFS